MTSQLKSMEDLMLNITQEIHVKASLERTFESLLDQLGPYNETPEGKSLQMNLEPWPGALSTCSSPSWASMMRRT